MSSTTRGWLIGLGVLNVVLFLTFVVALLAGGADTGSDDPGGSAAAETTQEESSAPETAEETTTPPASSPPPSATPSDTLAPAPEGALELASFTMPSRNISCDLGLESVSCTIAAMTFTPPAGEDCSWRGQVVVLDAQGVTMPCPQEAPTVGAEGVTVLDYGQSTVIGPWVCTSSQSGVDCSSRADGTSFSLARASFSSSGPGALG